MGWWETGKGDDITGDGPADTITQVLTETTQRREGQQRSRPSVEELLSAFVEALRREPTEILEDGSAPPPRFITAVVEPAGGSVVGGITASQDAALVETLREALEEIAVEYEDSDLERKPRLSELLAALSFVLSYEPERYLLLAEGSKVSMIQAADRPA